MQSEIAEKPLGVGDVNEPVYEALHPVITVDARVRLGKMYADHVEVFRDLTFHQVPPSNTVLADCRPLKIWR